MAPVATKKKPKPKEIPVPDVKVVRYGSSKWNTPLCMYVPITTHVLYQSGVHTASKAARLSCTSM